jgi:CRISP-associated protein Cas1
VLLQPNFSDNESLDEWAERNEYWLIEANRPVSRRKRRERNSKPLILCGHGVSLRVEYGALVIRDGFTHYPQQQAAYRFFPGDPSIPTRIMLLDGSGTLSFAVLDWLGHQGVALARVRASGEVTVVASGNGYAANPYKLRWQRCTRDDDRARLDFSTKLVREKFTASLVTLKKHLPASPARDRAIATHVALIERLRSSSNLSIDDLRGIEGQSASAYFAAWESVSLRWRGTRAIPDNWKAYQSRSSLANGIKAKNRNASHPINAMLNYAYTVKQAQLHVQAVTAGFDPSLGIMHHGREGNAAYIFDIIEPERPKVDSAILDFICKNVFSVTDFVLTRDGVCRLSPQLARAVAALVELS